jgi:hypothetical protein
MKRITTIEEAIKFYKKLLITRRILGEDTEFFDDVIDAIVSLLEYYDEVEEAIEAILIDTADKMRKNNGNDVHVNVKKLDSLLLDTWQNKRDLEFTLQHYNRKRLRRMGKKKQK